MDWNYSGRGRDVPRSTPISVLQKARPALPRPPPAPAAKPAPVVAPPPPPTARPKPSAAPVPASGPPFVPKPPAAPPPLKREYVKLEVKTEPGTVKGTEKAPWSGRRYTEKDRKELDRIIDWSWSRSRGVKRKENTWWQGKMEEKKRNKLEKAAVLIEESGDDEQDKREADREAEGWEDDEVEETAVVGSTITMVDLLAEHEEAAGYTFTSSGSGVHHAPATGAGSSSVPPAIEVSSTAGDVDHGEGGTVIGAPAESVEQQGGGVVRKRPAAQSTKAPTKRLRSKQSQAQCCDNMWFII